MRKISYNMNTGVYNIIRLKSFIPIKINVTSKNIGLIWRKVLKIPINIKKELIMKQNSIFTIHPYRTSKTGWAFDDDAVGLVREPFVAGADNFLSLLAGEADKMEVTFSADWFPSHQVKLVKLSNKELIELHILDEGQSLISGTYYKDNTTGHLMWLCPALNKYIDPSPNTIYVQYNSL